MEKICRFITISMPFYEPDLNESYTLEFIDTD